MKKGQISIEYLFVLAMSLAIIIPGSMMFYKYSNESNEKLVASQINKIGTNIINTAEEVYTVGSDTWITLDISFPEDVIDAYVQGNDLVIEYQTSAGKTESVFFSDVNIQAGYPNGKLSPSFHAGTMNLKVESKGDHVVIGEWFS